MQVDQGKDVGIQGANTSLDLFLVSSANQRSTRLTHDAEATLALAHRPGYRPPHVFGGACLAEAERNFCAFQQNPQKTSFGLGYHFSCALENQLSAHNHRGACRWRPHFQRLSIKNV